MGNTKLHSCDLWNRNYTSSIEGLFRIVELFFGGGAWGIMATTPFATTTGPFSFYMWVVVGSWAITLAIYLLNVTSPKLSPQPTLNSLVMSACFGVLHIIAAILFCVYAFEFQEWTKSQAITIAVLVWITTIIYLLHGSSLVTYFMQTGNKTEGEVTWFWEGIKMSSATTPKTKPARKQDANFSEVISNPVPVGSYGDPAAVQIDQGHSNDEENGRSQSVDHGVIYEDVPMEPSAPKVDYNNVQPSDIDQVKVKVEQQGRAVEENEYLNPV